MSAKSQKDRFKQSLKIAKARLQQYGFIVLSGDKLTDPIGLTPKGRGAEMRHQREGQSKTVLFDTLYDKFDLDGTKATARKVQEKAAEATAAKQEQQAQKAVESKQQSAAAKAQAKENAAIDRQVRKQRGRG